MAAHGTPAARAVLLHAWLMRSSSWVTPLLMRGATQTAIAEGLAHAIVQRRNPDGSPLPEFLHGKRILQLDVGQLMAGEGCLLLPAACTGVRMHLGVLPRCLLQAGARLGLLWRSSALPAGTRGGKWGWCPGCRHLLVGL